MIILISKLTLNITAIGIIYNHAIIKYLQARFSGIEVVFQISRRLAEQKDSDILNT